MKRHLKRQLQLRVQIFQRPNVSVGLAQMLGVTRCPETDTPGAALQSTPLFRGNDAMRGRRYRYVRQNGGGFDRRSVTSESMVPPEREGGRARFPHDLVLHSGIEVETLDDVLNRVAMCGAVELLIVNERESCETSKMHLLLVEL